MAEAVFVPFGVPAGTPPFSSVATRTALAAIPAESRPDGTLMLVRSDGSLWRFVLASTAAADALAPNAVTGANLVVVPAAGNGRWLRADKAFTMRLPFSTAVNLDGDNLFTCPNGFALRVTNPPYWDITLSAAGDTNLRIASSLQGNPGANWSAAGDFLGIAAQADLGVGLRTGPTVGAGFADADTANTTMSVWNELLLLSGDTIDYEITAAGTDTIVGMICVPVSVEQAAGVLPT